MSVLPATTSLLPASAGTGKTFRIVDLLLGLVVDEGQDLDRVVVVTFTEAAAGELRERIRHRLADALEGLEARMSGVAWTSPDPVLDAWITEHLVAGRGEPTRARLRSTLTTFDTACITTIHGFCTRVLTEAAFEAGAPFATELLGDASSVARDVVADFWLRHTWDAPPDTLRSFLALGFSRRACLDLATKAMNPDLRVVPADPGRPEAVDLRRWRTLLAQVARHADDGSAHQLLASTPDLARRRNQARGQHEAISRARVGKLFQELTAWLDGDPVPGPALPPCVRELSTPFLVAATVPGGTTPVHPLFDTLQQVGAERAVLAPALAAWRLSLQHQIVRDTRARLVEHLRARNALTFDEMLRRVRIPVLCRRRGPALREAVRQRYDAALVDEFQDTDPDQWDIFRSLFGDRLFLVGDPKQAIYSFRGADFDTYLRAEQACTTTDSLTVNFRSDDALVRAVDHLFARQAVQEPFFAAGIPYPAVAANRQQRGIVDDARPPLQIRLLGREGRRLQRWRWLANWQLERDLPAIVANDIVRQLQRGDRIRTADGSRPIGPGDCAVLTRKNAQARAIAQALVRRGVPATTRSDASVLASEAFDELKHVLRAVHDPLATAGVRRALLTGLLGATAAELASMASAHDLFATHAGRFRAWRVLWEEQGVLSVVRAMLDEGGVAERLLAQGRERRVTDLRHLGELFQRIAAERRLSPTALLGWIEEGCPGLDEDDVGLRLETDAEAVQCVTIHSAKGLEYPLVWAPWLHAGSWVAQLDQDHLVIADPDEPGQRRLDLGSPEKDELVAARREAAIAEDLRLIYVALTRARHRLVVYHGASGEDAALSWLLHQRHWMKPDRRDRWKQVQNRFYFKEERGEREVVEDLDALAVPDLVAWDRVDWADSDELVRWEPARGDEPGLRVATLSRATPPDRSWARTSFTGLARRVHELEPHPEVDHDAHARRRTNETMPLAQVRGSARFGTAVHSVLEQHDFQAGSEALGDRVGATLVGHGLPLAWKDDVTAQLQRMLETPLWPGFRLADLSPSDRWDELDFALPVHGAGSRFRVQALARAFEGPLGPGLDETWRSHLARLDFLPVHGFLVGSIDLVFRRDGRWYLVDYKSNTLGDRPAYRPDALRAPMYDALYPLQYHLYTVGLLRLLRARIPGFDVERDFGGVYYLFLRGMRPESPADGVFFDRPPAALIDRLDRALGGPA